MGYFLGVVKLVVLYVLARVGWFFLVSVGGYSVHFIGVIPRFLVLISRCFCIDQDRKEAVLRLVSGLEP